MDDEIGSHQRCQRRSEVKASYRGGRQGKQREAKRVVVAAEEEGVREEEEGHARRTRGQNQRRRQSEVRSRSIFVIFVPPDGQGGGEGRWGW